jgi:hypothetical protein
MTASGPYKPRVGVRGVLLTLALLLHGVGCLAPVGLPAPDIAIEPESPANEDDLVLVVEDLGDNPAGLSWSIAWDRDGDVQTDLAGAEFVPADSTSDGETWTATVALVLGDEVGAPAEESVTIGGGDDDDSGLDDDDSGLDDDDVSDDDDIVDDDDAVSGPGVGSRLCAAAGVSTNGVYSASTCTGPVEAAPGVVTNGTYTIRINRLAPPPE